MSKNLMPRFLFMESSFEKDYNEILRFAKRRVLDLRLSIEAEDLVNEAYLQLHNTPYSFEGFKKQISNEGLKEKHNTPQNIQWGDRGMKHISFTGDRCCRTCKEIKPVSEFYLITTKENNKYLRGSCKKCNNKKVTQYIKSVGYKYSKKYYQKIKNKAAKKNDNKKRMREWRESNRDKWNRYVKERYIKEKNDLSDKYIVTLLRKKYSIPYLNNHPELIIAKREMIKTLKPISQVVPFF